MLDLISQFTTALAKHLMSGCENVSPKEYDRRLLICATCPTRSGSICQACNCYIPAKAEMATAYCPKLNWEMKEPEGKPPGSSATSD